MVERIYLWPKLVECLFVVLISVTEFADTTQNALPLAQILGGVFSTVEAPTEALHIIYEPRSELLTSETVLVLPDDGKLDGAEWHLCRGALHERRYRGGGHRKSCQ